MRFEREIWIARPPEIVFALLRDKHTVRQAPGSPVVALEKTTAGPVGVGTGFREVVRMFPWHQEEILSEVTHFEPPRHLEEDFHAGVMHGRLAYQLHPQDQGTRLVQRQEVHFSGLLRLFEPLLRLMLLPRIEQRLEGIKRALESASLDD